DDVPWQLFASVAVTVSGNEPSWAGVPLNAVVLSESPGGSVPISENVTGATAPVAVKLCAYAAPSTANPDSGCTSIARHGRVTDTVAELLPGSGSTTDEDAEATFTAGLGADG